MKTKLTKAIARKVLSVVDAGLVNGVGSPIPGKMCVEAAVCFALGEPHGDKPTCVGAVVRRYKININDGPWSSDKARTAGLRRVAIAQLGSDQIDQKEFSKLVSLGVIQKILPIILRDCAKAIPAHANKLEASAVACEAAKTLDAASYAASYAARAARAASAESYAASDAASAASDAASAASYAASAASYAASAARADKILSLAAEIAVQALITLKTEGSKWLDICKVAA